MSVSILSVRYICYGVLCVLVCLAAVFGLSSRLFVSAQINQSSQTEGLAPLSCQDLNVVRYEDADSKIKNFVKTRDLQCLVFLTDNIENEWKQKDVEKYGEMMIKIISALSSYDFGDDKQYLLAHQYAKRALHQPNLMSLEQEIRIVVFLDGYVEYHRGNLSNNDWAKDRTERTNYWIHAWQRLESQVIPNYDFQANRPIYSSSMSSEERAEAQQYNQQRFLQRDRASFSLAFEKYLINAYTIPPLDKAELNGILQQYVSDPVIKRNVCAKMATSSECINGVTIK